MKGGIGESEQLHSSNYSTQSVVKKNMGLFDNVKNKINELIDKHPDLHDETGKKDKSEPDKNNFNSIVSNRNDEYDSSSQSRGSANTSGGSYDNNHDYNGPRTDRSGGRSGISFDGNERSKDTYGVGMGSRSNREGMYGDSSYTTSSGGNSGSYSSKNNGNNMDMPRSHNLGSRDDEVNFSNRKSGQKPHEYSGGGRNSSVIDSYGSGNGGQYDRRRSGDDY